MGNKKLNKICERIGYGLGIILMLWIFKVIIPYVIIGAIALFIWKAMTAGGNKGSRGSAKHIMFQSSARDGLGDAPRNAGDQVSDARDGVSHPYRTGRDRRNGR